MKPVVKLLEMEKSIILYLSSTIDLIKGNCVNI